MRMVGARKGDLLFSGKMDGNRIQGAAFIFNKICGPHPYEVDGNIDFKIGIIRISGNTPSLSSNSDVIKLKSAVLDFMITD